MRAFFQVSFAALAGLALGYFYFGGLWLTVRRLSRPRPGACLYLGSYFGRLAVCLAGFLLVAKLVGLKGLLVCLAAYTIVKLAMIRRLGAKEQGV